MSKYEFRKLKVDPKLPSEFFSNNTVIRIVRKDDALFKLVDKVRITEKYGPKKYKTLVISTEADFKRFNKTFAKKGVINWVSFANKYGGLVIEPFLTWKYFSNFGEFGWIDMDWYTVYGFIWRFQIKP